MVTLLGGRVQPDQVLSGGGGGGCQGDGVP